MYDKKNQVLKCFAIGRKLFKEFTLTVKAHHGNNALSSVIRRLIMYYIYHVEFDSVLFSTDYTKIFVDQFDIKDL